jgi:Tol biopolymer transport system component/DNA-binding winged helix-turn-helix (wHTH) protein
MKPREQRRFKFGEFEIDADRRLLLKDGQSVALNSKTFDLLLTLVEHRGKVVSKDELLDKVWEGQFVEEANLKVQVSTLRKVFGEKRNENRFIATVPGRGYSFVAELENDSEIVVESHRLSRILVEEEISESDLNDHAASPEIDLISGRPSTLDRIKRNGLAFAGGIVIVAALIGGYFFLRWRGSKNIPLQQISIRRLTNIGNVSVATIAPDGKLFAYAAHDGDQESVWVGHVDGGEPLQIRPPANVIYLALKFAPDGSSLYYTASESFVPGTLYRIPVFGGAPEKIRDNFRTLTFSPDGKRFAFIRYDEKRNAYVLMVDAATGNDESELAVLPNEKAVDWRSASWSPDGRTIALAAAVGAGEMTIFTFNIADGSVKRLASRSWYGVGPTTWVDDGGGLVATIIDKHALNTQLWYVSFPDGEVRRLTTDLNSYGFVSASRDGSLLTLEGNEQSNIWTAPSANLSSSKQVTFSSPGQNEGWSGVVWTYDGRIVYTADADIGTNLWIMDADGKNRKQITPNGGINYDPSVTADGRYLIFQSNRGGQWAVWRSGLDGSDLLQLTGDAEAGQPNVSPDGKWIVYESSFDGGGELWRISIDGSQPVKLSDKTAEWPQISPDGKFIACGLNIGSEMQLAILPIDGGEPLKTFKLPRLYNFRWGAHWTPDGEAITYRDWALGIWKQDIAGGEPQRLEGLPEEKLAAYSWSPDGSKLAFSRLNEPRDVILIKDLSN